MKSTIALLLLLSAPLFSIGQCDTVAIANTDWSVTYVDSEELTGEGANNGHAVNCFDNYSLTFWHTQWQNANPPFRGFPSGYSADARSGSTGHVRTQMIRRMKDALPILHHGCIGSILFRIPGSRLGYHGCMLPSGCSFQ